ncbi:MAG TPA: polyprenyl synthetase family protein [Thermomicrobiales bacterium]|nr:polyprenyl synthetase family protein [Thermomicrobiales bacterium]
MQTAALFEHVSQVLREAVEATGLPASFRALLLDALSREGKALAAAAGREPRWPALVLASCEAAGGDPAAAVYVAAAVDAFIAALDILDEVEDGDASALIAAAGMPRALNASTALLGLAHRLLGDLGRAGVPAGRLPRFHATLAEAGLAATGGQHLDLTAEGRAETTPEDAVEIARRKAGALVAGAFRLGALLGAEDEALLALYADLGRHYGTAAQLANDLHDVANPGRKTDLEREKGTLPLVFDRRGAPAEATADDAPPAERLRLSGALHFTWVVIELERQACARLLAELRGRGQATAWLERLLA